MSQFRGPAYVWRLVAPNLAAIMVAACSTSSIPPIQTSGSIGNTVKTQKFGKQKRELVNLATGVARANSYIVQPWIATAKGGISVAHETNLGGVRDTDSQFISGDVGIGVLPLSQYPTTIEYARTDSRASGDVGIDFVRDRVTVTNQAALPVGIKSFTNASYQLVDQFNFGSETSRNAGLRLSKTFQRSTIALGVKHSNSEFQSNVSEDETKTTNSATLNHNYRPRSDLTIQSNATATDTVDKFETRTRDRSFIQGISTTQWRPKNSPFTLNSAMRILRDDIRFGDSGSSSNDTETLLGSGTLGVNHRIQPRLNGNYGFNSNYRTTRRDSGGDLGTVPAGTGERLDNNLLAGISYLSLTSPIAGFNWRWDSSANTKLSYTKEDVGNDDGVNATGRLTLGHSVRRTIAVPLIGSSRFSASEKGTIARTENDEFVPTISHNTSITRSLSKDGLSSFIRVSLNDRRDLAGERATEFSFADLQISRRSSIDFKREWLGSIGAQVSRRKVRGEDAVVLVTANGRYGYFDRFVFGVENLRFSSELILNAIGLESVFTDRKRSDRFRDEFRSEFRNKLEYKIGKLTLSLEGSLFYINEELGDLSMFKIRRNFRGTF